MTTSTHFSSNGNYVRSNHKPTEHTLWSGIKWGCFSLFLFLAAVGIAYLIVSQFPY